MDETEGIRRALSTAINSAAKDRSELEGEFGEVWDTAQLTETFDVKGFLAPFVHVVRKSDGTKGLLMFQHSPRFYWGFESV